MDLSNKALSCKYFTFCLELLVLCVHFFCAFDCLLSPFNLFLLQEQEHVKERKGFNSDDESPPRKQPLNRRKTVVFDSDDE